MCMIKTPVKIQGLSGWIKKQDPASCCPMKPTLETNFKKQNFRLVKRDGAIYIMLTPIKIKLKKFYQFQTKHTLDQGKL